MNPDPREPGDPQDAARLAGRLTWAAYSVSFLAFAAGLVLLLTDRFAQGAGLALGGVLLATGAFVAPAIPWRAMIDGLKALRPPEAPEPAMAPPARGRRRAAAQAAEDSAAATQGDAPEAPQPQGRGLGRLALDLAESLMERLGGPDNVLYINRVYLLMPAVVLLGASAYLAVTSTVQAVAAFCGALMILWVYFQDMMRPLVLPHLRRNSAALAAQVPALPFHLYGAWLLNSRYERPSMVWLGFLVCMAASAWMYYALQRWTFDFTEADAPEPPLGWTVPRPFYGLQRISLIASLAAAAALAACLAVFVFPGDHAGASVAAAFAAMLLLIGSFPWIPGGLAFSPLLNPKAGALLAAAAALIAFSFGSHGQDMIEHGEIGTGLWGFLLGAVILVAVISRFPADPGRQEAEEAGAWPRLEIAALGLLLVVAFLFRIWKIGSFPFGVEGDEGGGGVWALNTLNGAVETPLIHQNYPLAFFSVTALFFKLGGVGIETLRLHSVFFGTLSVATTYFFLRLNMGRAAAFLATLLMAFSYWHLHYSRFGHYNIDQVAMQMAAFYFVFKAMRTNKLWQWGAGGVAFALAMFPHMAGRILPFQGIALLMFFLMARRDLLRRYLPGFLAFVILAWAVASPALVYWNRARGLSMGRIQSVSIFDKNNTNAPIDTLAGFVRNCKVSMLMFNYSGDSRSRDNPVAPDKILEHWTAILFGLAFLYTLYHWREPVNFFLLGVFFLNLCASVFSVEAPQTLRTSGNIPIVFAFMALPLADLEAALRRSGRWAPRLAFVGLLAAFSWFSYRSAIRLFVDERRMSFDTAATFIAQVAGNEGGPDTQGVFWGSGFASSHPPMQLLRKDTPLRNFYGPFEYLPITIATGHDNLLFLADDYQRMAPYIEWLYPKAPVRPIADQPGEPPVAQYIRVNKDVIRSSEGLDGTALINGKTVPVTGIPAQWPLPGLEEARRIAVSGSVSLDQFGLYTMQVTGRGDARVSVDGREIFSRRGGRVSSHPAELARGLHDIDLVLQPQSSLDAMRLESGNLSFDAKGPWNSLARPYTAVDLSHTLRMRANGFYGEYFATRMPAGKAVFENVEPIVLNHWLDSPIVGNWSVRWRTRFKTVLAGDYHFNVRGGSFSMINVDGKLVWRTGQEGDNGAWQPPVFPAVALKPGWHTYEAVFSTTGGPACDLDWTAPDGKGETSFWVPDMQPIHSPGRP